MVQLYRSISNCYGVTCAPNIYHIVLGSGYMMDEHIENYDVNICIEYEV